MRKLFPILLALAILLASAPLSIYAAPRAQTLPKAELVLWHQESVDLMKALGVQETFDKWAEKNAPGSKLTIVQKDTENLRTEFQQAALAGSGGPDLVWGPADQSGVFVAAGIIQPVDDVVDLKLFVPGVANIPKFGGKTYGIPLTAGNHLMLYYNKSMVEKAPATFEELVKVAKDLQSKNKEANFYPFAYNQIESFWVFPFAHGFGATEFKEDGKTPVLDSEGWVKAYQLIYDLKFTEKIEPTECDYDCADGGFKNGTIAMILNGDWALGGDNGYVKKLGDKLGIAPWPKVAGGGQPAPFVGGKILSIATAVKGDKFTTAAAFAKFLTTDEESVLARTAPQGILPPLLSALKNEKVTKDPVLAETSKVLVTGVAQPAQPEMRCVFDAVTTQTRALMNDSIKPDAAAKEAQKVALDCIAKLK